MSREKKYSKLAYILFEGDTEDIFYKRVFDKYLNKNIPRRYKNLKTGCGINKEVAQNIAYFLQSKINIELCIYVFIDREGDRSKIPEFNTNEISKALKRNIGNNKILIIKKIEAIRMIESWFLYDIESICKYIGLKCTNKIIHKYLNPEKYCSKELSSLFNKGSKIKYYKKGDKSFLNMLDIDLIYSKCKELNDGIQNINEEFM